MFLVIVVVMSLHFICGAGNKDLMLVWREHIVKSKCKQEEQKETAQNGLAGILDRHCVP